MTCTTVCSVRTSVQHIEVARHTWHAAIHNIQRIHASINCLFQALVGHHCVISAFHISCRRLPARWSNMQPTSDCRTTNPAGRAVSWYKKHNPSVSTTHECLAHDKQSLEYLSVVSSTSYAVCAPPCRKELSQAAQDAQRPKPFRRPRPPDVICQCLHNYSAETNLSRKPASIS